MKPPLKTYTICKSCSRPTRRDFYYNHLPEKIYAELTTELASSLTQKKIINQLAKVNSCIVSDCEPVYCKGEILPTVKPAYRPVNKMRLVSTYYHDMLYYPIGITCPAVEGLPYYRISTLSHLTTVENSGTSTPPFFVIL